MVGGFTTWMISCILLPDHDEDMTYRYYLYFIPDNGEMINNDFYFEDNKKVASIFGKQIVEIALPKQNINIVEFGQYYGDTRFWKASLSISDFVDVPSEIYISDYTDENWEKGYSNSENCFIYRRCFIRQLFDSK